MVGLGTNLEICIKKLHVFRRETIEFITKLLNVDKMQKGNLTHHTIDFWLKIL